MNMVSDEIETEVPAGPDLPELDLSGSHLRHIRFEDESADMAEPFARVNDEGEPEEGEQETFDLITPESFYLKFCGALAAPGIFLHERWQPLAVQDNEEEAARKTSDKIYGYLSRYFPSVLNEKFDELQDWLMIGGFVFAKVKVAAAITAASKLEAAQAKHDDGLPEFFRPANMDQQPAEMVA